jgi:flagellar basal-body rod protein FlgF
LTRPLSHADAQGRASRQERPVISGLYLSATGVMASSYRQDVIANNLPNSETTGFKRDLAMFRERSTEARERGLGPSASNQLLEGLSGGMFAVPTMIDRAQGDLETTGRNFDVAIEGNGYLMVEGADGARHLTRNGNLMTNQKGEVILADGSGSRVLDPQLKPITADAHRSIIASDGTITQNGSAVARLGVFNVPDESKLTKHGGTMLDYPDMNQAKATNDAVLRPTFLERSNVDPATELAQLMSAQRELEANANMIRYQDQTLSRLVNDVAKIS